MIDLFSRGSAAPPAPAVGAVPPGTPPPAGIKRLQVILVKPSKYDDDGYVMRYFRGVLPSNTLATLAGLTEEVASEGQLGDVQIDVVLLDELVQKVDARRLAQQHLRPGVRAVVALCGVQTNQVPRAADLARRLRAEGLQVMLGGFHVSGAIAMSASGMPPECQALLDQGITLVKGEVEECWGDLLRDALHGRLKAFYDVVDPPDLSRASIPVVDPRLMKRFAYPYMGTIDAGRGCPFHCSFCTIINVQGRKMRNRLASRIKDRIRRNAEHKIDYYFFTDDNFSRNPGWQEIFDALIELKREEGISIQFMMQIDTLAYRLPGFVEKAAEAGCTQVFIGMETLNPDNLPAAGKSQNRVGDYKRMIDAWHARGIACHVGYIIGFPFDTVESVREDVRRLREEIGVDQVSFFMLTPLPGSQDHRQMQERGEWMDSDYNRFDSFHPTIRHPRMSAGEWFDVYRQAWRDTYTVDAMKTVLGRTKERSYWGLFKNFVWYRHSAVIEGTHPMICGFFRLKDRKDKREGYPVDGIFKHHVQRAREVVTWAREIVKLYFDMQEVWLATRGRARLRENLASLRARYREVRGRLEESASRAGQALGQGIARVRAEAGDAWQRAGQAGRQAADGLAGGLGRLGSLGRLGRARVRRGLGMAFWRRAAARLNPFSLRTQTRAHLNAYWRTTYASLTRGQIFRINPFMLAFNLARDAKLCTLFTLSFLFSYGK
ncbi:MAG: radical SAM protein [Planctomycetes bacterium]|nr:radical SAM protein [Planctomycetota bacterium]